MDAQALTVALGGRWHRDSGMARCPAHRDRTPSLAIKQVDGVCLVHCHAGCEQDAVIDALQAQGLWPAANGHAQEIRLRTNGAQSAVVPSKRALALWEAAKPAVGTIVEAYLDRRGLPVKLGDLPSIRFLPRFAFAPRASFPVMIAAVVTSHGEITAVQLTAIDPRTERKARIPAPRLTFGPLGDGAVRLGLQFDALLGLAEGVEDALTAQMLTGVPCWATLGAKRMPHVAVPRSVRELHLFPDDDDAGRQAAERTAPLHCEARRRVRKRFPPATFKDWGAVAEAKAEGEIVL
jgi:hypothetical protein